MTEIAPLTARRVAQPQRGLQQRQRVSVSMSTGRTRPRLRLRAVMAGFIDPLGALTMADEPARNALCSLHEGARAFQRNLDHALRRQAEVDADPDPQRWEIEHAREAVTRATAAVAVSAVVLAMATAGS